MIRTVWTNARTTSQREASRIASLKYIAENCENNRRGHPASTVSAQQIPLILQQVLGCVPLGKPPVRQPSHLQALVV